MSSVPIDDLSGRRPGIGARIKRILPRTLEGRTLMIIVAPVVIAQLITAYIFFDRHFSALSVELARAVAGDIAMIIDQTEHDPDSRPRVFTEAADSLDLWPEYIPGAVLAPVTTRWNPLIEPVLETALQERVNRPFTIGSYGSDNWVAISVQVEGGVLEVRSPQRRLFSYTAFVFILWVIGASLLLTWIAVIFMHNQVRPIRRLAVAAESFGKGRDSVSLRPAGALEVRRAATAFITMRDRIRRQIAQRTEMLAGVSHDLRTPLTRMKLQLALLEDESAAEELRADVIEMETMIEAYLAFVRGEGLETPVATEIGALLAEIIDGLPGKEAVTLNVPQEITLEVRPIAMRRCLSNLLGNALRYGRRVAVGAGWRDHGVAIVIDDDGPGIPLESREEVFRAFVRIEPSRNLATGGVGLGLAIARDIAHGHGGEINLTDSPMGGLRVVLTLPG
jgi:two-component system osmolarity sensor histidine kinase EnvZ